MVLRPGLEPGPNRTLNLGPEPSSFPARLRGNDLAGRSGTGRDAPLGAALRCLALPGVAWAGPGWARMGQAGRPRGPLPLPFLPAVGICCRPCHPAAPKAPRPDHGPSAAPRHPAPPG